LILGPFFLLPFLRSWVILLFYVINGFKNNYSVNCYQYPVDIFILFKKQKPSWIL